MLVKELEDYVFTEGPFDRIYRGDSLAMVFLSEPLMGTGSFDENAWNDMCKMLGKVYGKGGGDLFILGGLVGEGVDVEEARQYIEEVPENVNIHVLYSNVDEDSIASVYSGLLDEISKEAKRAVKEGGTSKAIKELARGTAPEALTAKKRMPPKVKENVKKRAEEHYTSAVSSLGDNVSVYGSGEHRIEVKRDGKKATLLVSGNVLDKSSRSAHSSSITKRMHKEALRGKETDVDYVIDGYFMDFKFKPASPQKGSKPIYQLSLGPFHRAGGGSSGMVLLDHAETTRFTAFNLDNIRLEDDTLNAFHISDTHAGKGNMRKDLARSIAYLMENDKSVELVINTGDDYQSLNYRGAATEGVKKVRIDDQFISFWSTYLPSFLEVCERSRLKNPVLLVKGNHEKPLDEYGFNPAKMASFMFSSMQLMKSRGKDFVRFLPTDYVLDEDGEDSNLKDFPMMSFSVGHEGYGEHEILTKDGESYGNVILAHKLDAEGEKREPISRTTRWLEETGRAGSKTRMVLHGHAHLPGVGNVYDGIDITVGASLESKNRSKKNPWKTDSSYGIKTGFSEPVPGAWKKYVPREGAITSEFLDEEYLYKIYEKRIKKAVEDNVKRVPSDVKDTIL